MGHLKQMVTSRPGRNFTPMGGRNPSSGSTQAKQGQSGPSQKSQGEQQVRGGRLVSVASEGTQETKTPTLKLAVLKPGSEGANKPGSEGAREPKLSIFEKIFMAHFEGELPLGERLPPGVLKFIMKSEKGWTLFFQKFAPFMLQKNGNLAQVASFIFRGMMQSEGGKGVAYLIVDLMFQNGKVEKFVRLQMQGNEAMLQLLQQASPGKGFDRATLAKLLGQDQQFAYMALSHKVVNTKAMNANASEIAKAYQTPEAMAQAALREGMRDVSKGIALAARTEQAVAERLDINLKGLRGLDPSKEDSGKEGAAGLAGGLFGKKRKEGLFGGMFGGANGNPYGFVPWFQQFFYFRKQTGKPRWWVPLLYFTTVSAAGLFGFYVYKFLLQ